MWHTQRSLRAKSQQIALPCDDYVRNRGILDKWNVGEKQSFLLDSSRKLMARFVSAMKEEANPIFQDSIIPFNTKYNNLLEKGLWRVSI